MAEVDHKQDLRDGGGLAEAGPTTTGPIHGGHGLLPPAPVMVTEREETKMSALQTTPEPQLDRQRRLLAVAVSVFAPGAGHLALLDQKLRVAVWLTGW